MASIAGTGDKNTAGLAQGRKLHQEQINRGDHKGPGGRHDKITPEQKQRIRELYAVTKNGHEVARRLGLGSTTVYKHLALGKSIHPIWTDDEIQVMVDGYAEKKKPAEISKQLPGRSPRAVRIRMCRYREEVRKDPKKRRVLSAITMAFKAVRKADIFKELEE